MCRLCSGNTDQEMVPVSQLWEPVQQTTGPGQRRSVFWPSRTSAPTTAVSLLPPHRGDAGSNLLTLRTRCRRIGLVLGQQAVFQPVICSRNTARCPALSARGGALVTAPGTQGGCGRLGSGCGSVWLPAVTAGLLGQQVACWSAQDGGGAGVTGLALSLSWGCRSKSAQSGWLEISAVCSLPAQRPEVHSQEWAFLGAMGRTLPAPLGLSCLASVSPWSLPPSSPHSGPLPGVPASTFLSSWKDTSRWLK